VGKPCGYPRSARLRRRPEFLAVQKDGRRSHTAHFVVIARPAPGPTSRLGITASGRIGNAVVRNRIKRVVREVFRQTRPWLTAVRDVVVIAKPGAETLSYAQAAIELEPALARAGGR
jgi:ribonuclease P protein component